MIFAIFLNISLYLSPIALSLERPISSEEAITYDQKEVIVRGFLYKDPSGRLILSHRPDLKSCCVGSKALIDQQLLIEGSLPPLLTALELKGIFHINLMAHVNEENAVMPSYLLRSVEVINSSKSSLIYLGIFLSGFFFWLIFKLDFAKF